MLADRRHRAGMSLVLLGLVLVGFGAGAAGPAHAATRTVIVRNYVFDDATPGDGVVTATVGDLLRFSVQGATGQKHSINVDELAIASGEKASGATFDALATQAGTFALYCDVEHGSHAHAAQLVIAAPAGGGSGATTSTTTASGGATSTTRPASSTTARPGTGGATTSIAAGATGSGAGSPGAPAAPGSAAGGDAPPSTNAAGQLVTAEGEVIAQPEGGDSGDGSSGDSGDESAARRLLSAPVRAVGGGDAWIGLGGIALVIAGVAVLVMKRPKKDEPEEAQEIVVSDEWDDEEA